MFKLMANCFAWIKTWNSSPRDVKLMMIGLDDAGKTTMLASLQGEPPDGITPTVGFANANLNISRWNITLFDLGGGYGVRSVWEKYYAEIYGIIFVVDSVNESRIDESSDVLEKICNDSKVDGKPILILGNKQDKEGALGKEKIIQRLHLNELSKAHDFKFNVFLCSATKGYGKNTDQSINLGLNWLLECIKNDHHKIHQKVEKESAIQREIEAKEKTERMERIKKLREEREKAALEAGIDIDAEDSEDDVVSGNPFRNIKEQIKVTEKREKKSKERDRKIKDFQAKIIEKKNSCVDEESSINLKSKTNKNIVEESEKHEEILKNTLDDNPVHNKKRNLKKKKVKKKIVTPPSPPCEVSNDNKNEKSCKKVTNKKNIPKENFINKNDISNTNYTNFQSSQIINSSDDLKHSGKTKKFSKKVYYNENDSCSSTDRINGPNINEVPILQSNKSYNKLNLDSIIAKEKPVVDAINGSRVHLFLARSSNESLGNSSRVECKKKTKKIEIDANRQLKKKEKKNRTAPIACSSPNEVQDCPDLFESKQNGHAFKLEPIKQKGRIPSFQNDSASIPSWARPRPNCEEQEAIT